MGYFLAPSTSAALSRLAALDAAPGSVPLDRLRAIRSLLRELDADPATLVGVRDALRGGADWDEVSDAAGLKPAAAKWRWSGTDAEIAARQAAGRKRAARPSAVPTDLPGLSVSEAAAQLGVTAQAIYLKLSRGKLSGRTVELADGRSYKRVFLDGDPETRTESRTGDEGTDAHPGGDADARLDRAEPAEDNDFTASSPDATRRSPHHD